VTAAVSVETCSFSQFAAGGDLRKRTVRSEIRSDIFFYAGSRFMQIATAKRIT
jgi:hypothetical protein